MKLKKRNKSLIKKNTSGDDRLCKKKRNSLKSFLINNSDRMFLNPTKAEEWAKAILEKEFDPWIFNQQYIFNKMIFDFYFKFAKIRLEIDGEYHFYAEQTEKDKIKDDLLFQSHGVKTLRCKNFDKKTLISHINEIKLSLSKVTEKHKQKQKFKYLNRMKQLQKRLNCSTGSITSPKIKLRKHPNNIRSALNTEKSSFKN